MLTFTTIALSAAAFSLQPSTDDGVVFITRQEQIPLARIVEITDDHIKLRIPDAVYRTVPRGDAIGFLNTPVRADAQRGGDGVIALTDGQRLPGAIETESETSDMIVWTHHWLGELNLPLARVSWARFDNTHEPIDAGDADAILLTNGDRLEGFLESVGQTVRLELGGAARSLPLETVAAIRLVNPDSAPASHTSRVWLADGSVADVGDLALSDDGYLRFTVPLSTDRGERAFPLNRVAGVLFDATALTALASIEPHDVEGPVTRYVLPEPEVSAAAAALDMRDILFDGPVTARYALPEGGTIFSAHVALPERSGEWADLEFVVLDDDREVFRTTMNAEAPTATVNVRISGAELTIAVLEGANGPIQDRVILSRAMILSDR